MLARSRPLVLPPAAALFAAGGAGDVEDLERLVAALVTAHQLFADLLDVEKDWENGNRTHVLFRLSDKVVGNGGARALRVALFARGEFDAVVSDAAGELARTRRAADTLAMPEAIRFCDERARLMTEIQEKISRHSFRILP